MGAVVGVVVGALDGTLVGGRVGAAVGAVVGDRVLPRYTRETSAELRMQARCRGQQGLSYRHVSPGSGSGSPQGDRVQP